MTAEAGLRPVPALSDPARIAAVAATGLVGSTSTEAWDGLIELAAQLLDAPLALLTLVDEDTSHWLSSVGFDEAARSQAVPVAYSFCQYVLEDDAPVAVADLTESARTRENPSIDALGVRACVGFPVRDADERILGTFCVLDRRPRDWSPEELRILGVLARAASAQVVLLSAVASERAAREALAVALELEERVEARLERLSAVALELSGATDLPTLTRVVVSEGLPVLDASGGAVLVIEEGRLQLTISDLGEHVQQVYGELPLDSPLPAAHVARTGRPLTLPSRGAGIAFHPSMAQVYEDTGRSAWVFAPLTVSGEVLGSLAVSWVEERSFTPDDVSLVAAFAAQCAQALVRIRAAQAEREASQALQHLSEALQRSLLTQPPTPPTLEIAVRYLPAVQAVQVGGDWYDAFTNASGATLVSVGDVAGHDRNAAGAMAQVRNLLRGLAIDSDDSPAMLLTRLDRALGLLELDTLATAVLARIDQTGSGFRVRWSSAGHLPPMIRLPDATVRTLSDDSDLLLGLDSGADRVERVTDLPDGAVLLLYTDGLLERRGESISLGLRRLQAALAGTGNAGPELVCDRILEAMLEGAPEDDVAMLVLRIGRRDPWGARARLPAT